jgi:ribose 5-phosphate isomerase A
MERGGSDEAKRRAGEAAAERVTDGEVVGLGTGSTAAHAVRALGRRVDAGLDVRGVPTSYQSRQLAREVGVPLTTLEDATPDVAIDGADEVTGVVAAADGAADGAAGAEEAAAADEAGAGEKAASDERARFDCVKGGGAAHAREKVVDAAADRLLLVVDPSKLADALSQPVPVAVLPDAVPTVADRVRDLGGEPELRAAERKDGPVVTDNGNLVLDCAFGPVETPADLAPALSAVPGAVEHGLFVDLADAVVVGREDGVDVYSR